jgi:hypothetical protein
LRSRAPLLVLAIGAVTIAALALVAQRDGRTFAFTSNVRPTHVVASAVPGGEACQREVEAIERFDAVEALIGTHARPGPPVAVTVRERGGGRVVARGRLPAGAPDNRAVRVVVEPSVGRGQDVDVCFRNEGGSAVAFYGGAPEETPGHAFEGSRPGAGDMRLVFFRGEPRSVLSMVPRMFERAAVFRPDPVAAWTFWGLLALVAAGVPGLLALALRAALREETGGADRT